MAEVKTRLGRQTPTQSVILPYEVSRYEEAVELYQLSKRTAQEWQVGLLKDILAIDENGVYIHAKFGYSVPRRNGKNEVVAIRELYGLEKGESMLHTAHRTNTSHSAWERLKKIIEDAGYKEDEDYVTLKALGNEKIEFLATGGRVQFRTRTSTGGLGEGFDLLIIDEAQEYTDDQETSLKYVVSDSDNPQTIFCGTPPTPVSSGTVFTKLRQQTLEGKSKYTGWAEWSVEDQSDVHDVELWYETNPSMGTILNERKVDAEIGEDEIDFNIQRLGLWIKYNQHSAILAKDWEKLKVENKPKFTGKLFVGIKYGQDGTNAAMSIAVKTTEDKIYIESIDCQNVRNGNSWILEFLKQIDYSDVVIDGASGQNLLAKDMRSEKLRKPILPTVKEIIVANSAFERAIYQETIQHNDQPSLTAIVTNADKRLIGSNGGFGYKSIIEDYDVALMDSAILAHWLAVEDKPKVKQKIWY